MEQTLSLILLYISPLVFALILGLGILYIQPRFIGFSLIALLGAGVLAVLGGLGGKLFYSVLVAYLLLMLFSLRAVGKRRARKKSLIGSWVVVGLLGLMLIATAFYHFRSASELLADVESAGEDCRFRTPEKEFHNYLHRIIYKQSLPGMAKGNTKCLEHYHQAGKQIGKILAEEGDSGETAKENPPENGAKQKPKTQMADDILDESDIGDVGEIKIEKQ